MITLQYTNYIYTALQYTNLHYNYNKYYYHSDNYKYGCVTLHSTTTPITLQHTTQLQIQIRLQLHYMTQHYTYTNYITLRYITLQLQLHLQPPPQHTTLH